jgi:hypothetical protein
MRVQPEAAGDERQVLRLRMESGAHDFESAAQRAREAAREISRDAMMLSWYDRERDTGYPAFECSGSDRPPWQVFAESRGANLIVEINEGAYLFFFLKL